MKYSAPMPTTLWKVVPSLGLKKLFLTLGSLLGSYLYLCVHNLDNTQSDNYNQIWLLSV
jgi:hypothetical protein